MGKSNLIIAVLLVACLQSFAQHRAMSFKEAKKQGISVKHLDSIYKSALHTDTSLAVFKTSSDQNAMLQSYVKLLQDFGEFLSENNFKWEKPTRCFNRIYFSADGTIDYFLFNFQGSPQDKPAEHIEKEFQSLLSIFISDYKFPLTAKMKFAQCSPTTYMPKQ